MPRYQAVVSELVFTRVHRVTLGVLHDRIQSFKKSCTNSAVNAYFSKFWIREIQIVRFLKLWFESIILIVYLSERNHCEFFYIVKHRGSEILHGIWTCWLAIAPHNLFLFIVDYVLCVQRSKWKERNFENFYIWQKCFL